MTVFGSFDGFGGSGEIGVYPSFMLLLQNRAQWGNRCGFDGLEVSAAMAVSVITATPLKLKRPLFLDPDLLPRNPCLSPCECPSPWDATPRRNAPFCGNPPGPCECRCGDAHPRQGRKMHFWPCGGKTDMKVGKISAKIGQTYGFWGYFSYCSAVCFTVFGGICQNLYFPPDFFFLFRGGGPNMQSVVDSVPGSQDRKAWSAMRFCHLQASFRPYLVRIQENVRKELTTNCHAQFVQALSGVIRANRFARFARIGWFARIGNSSDSCESAWRAIKIGVSIANDSRESIRAANRVANRPCH